jgi:NAD(P)-dependent dehydrogenase (short-subunit alcohol dehydrogenase family)
MKLKDKVAIVTGGGSGIGQAIAQRFAQEGAKVVVVDRLGEKAQGTAAQIAGAGGEALAVMTDVSDKEGVEVMVAQALERYGQVDILVNNAAVAEGEDLLQLDESVWDFNLEVTLKGVFLCSQAVLPAMIGQKGGAIVNIASVNGLAAFGHPAYSAAKAGVLNLTKNMAVSYGGHGVRVNAICPGTIRTPIWQSRVELDPQIFERLAKWYPLGRVGEPEDVAKAALFLASDDASWITGETLTVDGGLMAGSYRMSRELEANTPEQKGL